MNCRIGDLAIAVEAELPENIGKLVRIVGKKGLSPWSNFEEPLHLWIVEALGPECPLVYDYGRGDRICELRGLVPDIFLRPIRPHKVSTDNTARELAHV